MFDAVYRRWRFLAHSITKRQQSNGLESVGRESFSPVGWPHAPGRSHERLRHLERTSGPYFRPPMSVYCSLVQSSRQDARPSELADNNEGEAAERKNTSHLRRAMLVQKITPSRGNKYALPVWPMPSYPQMITVLQVLNRLQASEHRNCTTLVRCMSRKIEIVCK